MSKSTNNAFKASYRNLTLRKQCHFAIQARALSKAVEELSKLQKIPKDVILFSLFTVAKFELEAEEDGEVERFIEGMDKLVEQAERLEEINN